MVVTQSYNSPDNTGSYFLKANKTHGGCPHELVNDLGMENNIITWCHSGLL